MLTFALRKGGNEDVSDRLFVEARTSERKERRNERNRSACAEPLRHLACHPGRRTPMLTLRNQDAIADRARGSGQNSWISRARTLVSDSIAFLEIEICCCSLTESEKYILRLLLLLDSY